MIEMNKNPCDKYDGEVFLKYGGEVFLYYGDISRSGYHQISEAYEKKFEKRDKVCIVLITCGGDPDAAYRIARATNHHFKTVEILIPDICKSAGTLLCIGAHKLIFGDRGELGPLDIQLSKPDEMFESMSGLDIIQAISALENQVLNSFRAYLIDIRGGSRIRTKLAAEIAAKLVDGFITPITSRIDPLTLGEHQRAMQIALGYGERLSAMTDSLKPGALIKLISYYPSHGFVIDRKEAGSLFNSVTAPDEITAGIYWLARRYIIERLPYPAPHDQPIVFNLTETNFSIEQQELTDENNRFNAPRDQKENEAFDRAAECKSEGNEPDISQSCESRANQRSASAKRTRPTSNKAFDKVDDL
jgi:hypothetical protein